MAVLPKCEVVGRENVGMIILLDLKVLARRLTECYVFLPQGRRGQVVETRALSKPMSVGNKLLGRARSHSLRDES